ncbi:hypothetical protein SLEP1_g36939 [Rubroshorea leprosula]|uniref:Reverse transcriptase zinc-binding domain-containing protein n=1 Tax=Rubroshorea leprosula TaxID=152421 RepID=A0AAV5KTJ1_9ROSI|nr:hypothetical protein SLEP1_g36939 [Rubroshorea leprosula]
MSGPILPMRKWQMKKQEKKEWNGLKVRVDKEDVEWLENSYVGRAKCPKIISTLQEKFMMEKVLLCKGHPNGWQSDFYLRGEDNSIEEDWSDETNDDGRFSNANWGEWQVLDDNVKEFAMVEMASASVREEEGKRVPDSFEVANMSINVEKQNSNEESAMAGSEENVGYLLLQIEKDFSVVDLGNDLTAGHSSSEETHPPGFTPTHPTRHEANTGSVELQPTSTQGPISQGTLHNMKDAQNKPKNKYNKLEGETLSASIDYDRRKSRKGGTLDRRKEEIQEEQSTQPFWDGLASDNEILQATIKRLARERKRKRKQVKKIKGDWEAARLGGRRECGGNHKAVGRNGEKGQNRNDVYSLCDKQGKHRLRDELLNIIEEYGVGNWCIGGDFNAIRDMGEKKGKWYDPIDVRDFSKFITDAGLEDIPMAGRKFTWYKSDSTAMSKLDSKEENDMLVATFMEKEIKEAVWSCNGDKSPGPDGLNFKFIKRMWLVMKEEICRFIEEFHSNGKLIKGCLHSASSSVLVNGSPTKEFQMEKVLRQGDLLAPFLFLVVVEALNGLITKVADEGIFKGVSIDHGGGERDIHCSSWWKDIWNLDGYVMGMGGGNGDGVGGEIFLLGKLIFCRNSQKKYKGKRWFKDKRIDGYGGRTQMAITRVSLKVSAFAWKVMQNRIPTKKNLQKRKVLTSEDDVSCALCGSEIESSDHLLFMCLEAWKVWSSYYNWWGINVVSQDKSWNHLLQHIGLFTNKITREAWMVIWFAAIWNIWLWRNPRVFKVTSKHQYKIIEVIKCQTFQWLKAYVWSEISKDLWYVNPTKACKIGMRGRFV